MRALLDIVVQAARRARRFFHSRHVDDRSGRHRAAHAWLFDGRHRRVCRLLPCRRLVSRARLRAAPRRSHPRHADPATRCVAARAGGWKCFAWSIASALSVYFAYFAAKLVWGSYAFNDISQNVDATPLWIPQLSMAIGLAGLALAFIEQLVITVADATLAARGQRSGRIDRNEAAEMHCRSTCPPSGSQRLRRAVTALTMSTCRRAAADRRAVRDSGRRRVDRHRRARAWRGSAWSCSPRARPVMRWR